ncbi:MAG: hypothetical protein WCL18_10550 [bacterium]
MQLLFFVWHVQRTSFPLIVDTEWESIRQIPTIIPVDAKIMVTGRKYSAFLMGYASHHIIAPGLFDLDAWTQEQWNTWHFGDGALKCQLLKAMDTTHRPNYLWIGSLQPFEQLS